MTPAVAEALRNTVLAHAIFHVISAHGQLKGSSSPFLCPHQEMSTEFLG